jgi:hypothetical protein
MATALMLSFSVAVSLILVITVGRIPHRFSTVNSIPP